MKALGDSCKVVFVYRYYVREGGFVLSVGGGVLHPSIFPADINSSLAKTTLVLA
jgi:hypothetical protein